MAEMQVMGNVINFNRARKRKLREDAQKQAAENRARFGRTKMQKERDAAEAEQAQRRLEQIRRETPQD